MTETSLRTGPSTRRDLLLALAALPLLGGACAVVAFTAYALAMGAAMSDAGGLVLLLVLAGGALALAPAVVVAWRTGRAGWRMVPVAALLSPLTAHWWFQLV
ncbi:hypothetical protein [Kitasatospora sp. NBC_00458]|uniref:hypothetical protein n=1 Tax=Kitasatospora sp. NBC_00458 TaxID=2903568 RepID=UPI002E1961EA